MSDNRKVLIIARHGDTPKDPITKNSLDDLTDVPKIYHTMGEPLREFVQDFSINDAFLWHSDKKRTAGTGRAAVVGAFCLRDKTGAHRIPQNLDDLSNFDYGRLSVSQHPLLGFGDLKMNDSAFAAPPIGLGEDGYMFKWISDPTSTVMQGKPNASFNYMVSRGRNVVRDAINLLLVQDVGQRDLGFLATHAACSDSIGIALTNSARDVDDYVKNFEEVGGLFKKGDYAVVVAEKTSAGIWKAEYRKGDVKVPVDIERFY